MPCLNASVCWEQVAHTSHCLPLWPRLMLLLPRYSAYHPSLLPYLCFEAQIHQHAAAFTQQYAALRDATHQCPVQGGPGAAVRQTRRVSAQLFESASWTLGISGSTGPAPSTSIWQALPSNMQANSICLAGHSLGFSAACLLAALMCMQTSTLTSTPRCKTCPI